MNVSSKWVARLATYMVEHKKEEQFLPCFINDKSLLSFLDLPFGLVKRKVEIQDLLEEVNLRNQSNGEPTFVSMLLPKVEKKRLIKLLKNVDCFAWTYDEMSSLSQELYMIQVSCR